MVAFDVTYALSDKPGGKGHHQHRTIMANSRSECLPAASGTPAVDDPASHQLSDGDDSSNGNKLPDECSYRESSPFGPEGVGMAANPRALTNGLPLPWKGSQLRRGVCATWQTRVTNGVLLTVVLPRLLTRGRLPPLRLHNFGKVAVASKGSLWHSPCESFPQLPGE